MIEKDKSLYLAYIPRSNLPTQPTHPTTHPSPSSGAFGSFSLTGFFEARFGAKGTEGFQKAQRRFIESLAAYSIACYLLQIKDRYDTYSDTLFYYFGGDPGFNIFSFFEALFGRKERRVSERRRGVLCRAWGLTPSRALSPRSKTD